MGRINRSEVGLKNRETAIRYFVILFYVSVRNTVLKLIIQSNPQHFFVHSRIVFSIFGIIESQLHFT